MSDPAARSNIEGAMEIQLDSIEWAAGFIREEMAATDRGCRLRTNSVKIRTAEIIDAAKAIARLADEWEQNDGDL